jgi:transposase-like protein
MVAESRALGARVLAVGRRYDVKPNQLYAWRRQFSADDLAPVSAPAKTEFILIVATLIVVTRRWSLSIVLLSISTRPSSRKTERPFQ